MECICIKRNWKHIFPLQILRCLYENVCNAYIGVSEYLILQKNILQKIYIQKKNNSFHNQIINLAKLIFGRNSCYFLECFKKNCFPRKLEI